MILESKGTPDILLDIIAKYESEIINNAKNLNSLSININESNLVAHLTINFKNDNNKSFSGNLNFKECIDSNFNNCIINLSIPNFNLTLIFKSLMHELTHLYEIYQIKDFYLETKWKRLEALHDTEYQNVNTELHYFRDIFYLSFPYEINARVSSLYKYLFDTKIKDKVELEKILIKTIEWQNMLNLKNFTYKEVYDNLIKKYINNKILLYDIFNLFNLKMKIKTTINSDIDLYNYLKNSSKYFKSVSSNFKKKIIKILYRVVDDRMYEGYWTIPTKIVVYDDYIKKHKEENKDIDYLMFL